MKARASAKKRENPWHVHQFPGWLAAGRSGPAPSISAAPDEKGRVVKKRNETRKYFFFFYPPKEVKKYLMSIFSSSSAESPKIMKQFLCLVSNDESSNLIIRLYLLWEQWETSLVLSTNVIQRSIEQRRTLSTKCKHCTKWFEALNTRITKCCW